MENKDDIFEQFKTAAENAETKEFPAMDKVWNRVEDKLDHKILTKENTLWKKLAVAASVLLVVSIGYQFLKNDKQIVTPAAEIVTIDTTKTTIDSIPEEVIVLQNNTMPEIKPNAETILQEHIKMTNSAVVVTDSIKVALPKIAISTYEIKNNSAKEVIQKPVGASSIVAYDKSKASGVRQNIYFNTDSETKSAKQVSKKEEPLFVIDDKVENLQKLGKLDPDEIEDILVLPDPLYIINGVEYSEKEVFGPNPTSPYSPLNKQEIETLSILQNEKATSIYGDKGKKGVVIITTKGGKPATKTK